MVMPCVDRSVRLLAATAALLFAWSARAQSFRVQCPATTPYPSLPISAGGVTIPAGKTKCQQLSGGDGFVTMADGTQTYLFAFGPLSGMADIVKGLPGTMERPAFMLDNTGRTDVVIGAPTPSYGFNGAVGLVPDVEANAGTGTAGAPLDGHVDPRLIMDVGTLNGSQPAPMMAIDEDDELFVTLTNVGQVMRPDLFEQHTVHFHGYPNASAFYDGVPDASIAINIGGSFTYYYLAPDAGTYFWHCHITPPEHLQMGMVGQIYVRPRQNRLAPGTSLYAGLAAMQTNNRTKCDPSDPLCSHVLPASSNGATQQAGATYAYDDGDGSTRYDVEYPIQLHGFDPNFHFVGMTFNPESFTDLKDKYFLINGRSYPDTVGGHTCGSGDPWPACAGKAAGDVVPGPMRTQGPDGVERTSQPQATVINIPAGGRALLRVSDLNITEMHTLGTLGIPMTVVGWNARMLRDQDGNNLAYRASSITLGGGESADVILDACQVRAANGACTTVGYTAGQKFYLYSPKLDALSNDAENFGGMMTEINICDSVDRVTKQCAVGATVAGNL
jgi:FtsP/CotA-like multicopper oxidase with cupredoxin domain